VHIVIVTAIDTDPTITIVIFDILLLLFDPPIYKIDIQTSKNIYRIRTNIGEELNLANWRIVT